MCKYNEDSIDRADTDKYGIVYGQYLSQVWDYHHASQRTEQNWKLVDLRLWFFA